MGLCPLGGGAGSVSNTIARAEAYLRIKWHLDPSSRLVTINIGQKMEALPLLGGAGSPSNTIWHAWAKAYIHTKWHLDPSSRLATTDMGRKLGWGGYAPLGEWELGPI